MSIIKIVPKILPWKDKYLNIPYEIITQNYYNKIIKKLTPKNPKYITAKKLGISTYKIKKKLYLSDHMGRYIRVPREFPTYLQEESADLSKNGQKVRFTDNIILDSEQEEICLSLVNKGNGIVKADCGRGKTIVLLKTISRIGKRTLVMVHSNVLADQWIEVAQKFLGIKKENIGFIGGGKKIYGKKLTIGLAQTVHKGDLDKGFVDSLGVICCDEVHKFSAPTFIKAITQFSCKHRFGATATEKRGDGLGFIFKWHIGNVYEIDDNSMTPTVFVVRNYCEINEKKAYCGKNLNIPKLVSLVSNDPIRLDRIAKMISFYYDKKKEILVLCDRVTQAENIYKKLKGKNVGLLVGKTKDKKAALEKRIIVATQHILKEGVNKPKLDVLIDIGVYGDSIRAIQSAGRVKRFFPGKVNPIIVCYRDYNIPICNALINRRIRDYKRSDFKVREVKDIFV